MLGVACRGPAPPSAAPDASVKTAEVGAPQPEDAQGHSGPSEGEGRSSTLDAPPDVMVWAADRATREGDLASARRLIGMALAKLGTTLAIQPAAGLLDAAADLAADETTSRAELLSDFAANGSVLAVAHGGLLSAIDLRSGYRLLRLASHSATIRQIKVSASGRYVATFADDQSLRLFSLPTGTQVLELPLSLDFLALGERRHAALLRWRKRHGMAPARPG